MKKQKRLLSLLLSVVMGLAVLPVAVLAAEEPQFPLADVAVPVWYKQGEPGEWINYDSVRINHVVSQETVTFEGEPMELYNVYPGAMVWKTTTDVYSAMKAYNATLKNGVLTQGELDYAFEIEEPWSHLGYLSWGEDTVGNYYIAEISGISLHRKVGIHVVEGTLPENVPTYYAYDVGFSQTATYYKGEDQEGIYVAPAGTVVTLPYETMSGEHDALASSVGTCSSREAALDAINGREWRIGDAADLTLYMSNGRECFTVEPGMVYQVHFSKCPLVIIDGEVSAGISGFLMYIMGEGPVTGTAQENKQVISIDGKDVSFAMYSPDNGGTNYVRLVDLAVAMKGTAGQFNVGYDGKVLLTAGAAYEGAASTAPFHGEMEYTMLDEATYVNGVAQDLEAIRFEYQNGGYTYYKLRDLGEALGFNVGWDRVGEFIYIESDKPYDPTN